MVTPINYIHDSSVSMIKMVNGLLSVTRLEKGRIELNIQDVLIASLVHECINDVELSAKEKGLYLKYIEPKKPITIKGDPEKIKQAVTNIINNALLYTPKGGVTVNVCLSGEFVKISIKDTGIGIDEEDLGKIFQSFARGKRGVELYTQGTGLGLYVAKSFIEMHNGKISVVSKGKDKGSTFEIIIPIKTMIIKKQEFSLLPETKET
jgi:signal transduction histidine kinase